jgi:hypothetical protein
MTHRLQSEFAREEGEARYVERLRKLVAGGYLDAAEGILITDLASLDSDFATQCAHLKREHVELSGWPELIDAMSLFEGEPITGMTIGIANDADLNFEKGVLHAPYLLLGLYTDEAFGWSAASREDILDQLGADAPRWAGCEEDIEIYLEVEGLETINTALIHHKHRFFLRDGDPDKAPLGYVEYVLASWLRALRFHQAIAAQIAEHGLPGSVPVVSGTVDLRPEIATVHFPEKSSEVEQAQFASLTAATPRRTAEIIEFERPNIRAQIAAANANAGPGPEPEQAKPGLFGRMFGRS